MSSFFRDDGRAALTRAIAEFEAKTAAELVIAVRPRSDGYLLLNIELGLVAALSTLAYLLYGEPEFDLHWFLLLPLTLGLLAGTLAALPPVQRLLVGAARREAAILRAARATFVERGVADTRARTGLLLYVSLAERDLALVPDTGLRRAVPPAPWAAALASLRAALARGRATALVPAILALGDLCGDCLPRPDDDTNELPDEVHP